MRLGPLVNKLTQPRLADMREELLVFEGRIRLDQLLELVLSEVENRNRPRKFVPCHGGFVSSCHL